jgi:hypothetical protein
MNTPTEQQLKQKIRTMIVAFVALLILSGITAFPLEWELSVLTDLSKNGPEFFKEWAGRVYHAIKETNEKYPFMAYGTDWLAFAHIVIGVAFIGPMMDPVKNIWVIQFGMIACLMVFPLAFICGPIRGIPFYWRLVDCSFGAFGLIPLYSCYRKIKTLEKIVINK